MNSLFKLQTLIIGLALFSMFFGAGNIIFPLAVGQLAKDQNVYAISGLILTAALMPIGGVIAMILFDGNFQRFFGRLGKIPGFLLALLSISLLGPLGSTPRCIALSYTTLKSLMPGVSPMLFSAFACGLVYLFTVKKKYILPLLGWVLTPLLLVSLASIILMGLFKEPSQEMTSLSPTNLFMHGLKEGYNTMDLLAAFFFSSSILNMLKLKIHDSKEQINTAISASILGAFLLTSTYIGFSYLAALHGGDLDHTAKDELLSAITFKIAGAHAGPLICISIALACLTTAIALISSFADFIQKEVFLDKFSYEATLFGSLMLTFFISTYEFSGISLFLNPILEICYPGLIVLTILNIAYRIKDFEPIKLPVFFTFVLSACLYYF